MTKDEAYKLMQKQNWYKFFLKEVATNSCEEKFNESFREIHLPTYWIDKALYWDETSQGNSYWSDINVSFRKACSEV